METNDPLLLTVYAVVHFVAGFVVSVAVGLVAFVLDRALWSLAHRCVALLVWIAHLCVLDFLENFELSRKTHHRLRLSRMLIHVTCIWMGRAVLTSDLGNHVPIG